MSKEAKVGYKKNIGTILLLSWYAPRQEDNKK